MKNFVESPVFEFFKVSIWEETADNLFMKFKVEEDGDTFFEGYIKWDGCWNLTGMPIHFCRPKHIAQFYNLMRFIHGEVVRITGYDIDVWGYPDIDLDPKPSIEPDKPFDL